MTARKWGWILLIYTFLAFDVTGAHANEGRIILRGRNLACEGVSIWKERYYQITGRCSGLVYPYQERLNQYILWARTDDTGVTEPVDNIEKGLFEGTVTQYFSEVFITVESEFSPIRPGSLVLVSGNVNRFNFNTSEPANESPLPVQPSLIPTPKSTPNPAISNIGTSLKRLAINLVLVAIVIGIAVAVFQFVARRGEKDQ